MKCSLDSLDSVAHINSFRKRKSDRCRLSSVASLKQSVCTRGTGWKAAPTRQTGQQQSQAATEPSVDNQTEVEREVKGP